MTKTHRRAAQRLQDLPPEVLQEAARRVATQMTQEQAKRQQFAHSETFARMLSAFRDCGSPRRLRMDDIDYRYVQTVTELGWTFASLDDVRMFIEVVANPKATTMDVNSYTEDPECAFPNCSFSNFGLRVWMMFGQGTALTIRNEAAFRLDQAGSQAA